MKTYLETEKNDNLMQPRGDWKEVSCQLLKDHETELLYMSTYTTHIF